jgi:heavy metal sensor kinase
MAAVLAALGGYVYLRVSSTLLHNIDQNLLAQSAEASVRVSRGRAPLDRDADNRISFAQVLTPAGAVAVSDPPGLGPLLDAGERHLVASGRLLRSTVTLPGRTGRWRVLGLPVQVKGAQRELVLVSPLETRSESLERIRKELLVASPLALLLATLAGYVLAGAALRPVEEMRRRASAVSAATPGTRLPVPPAKDEISRLAETLNEMLDRLETAFEHERRFVADASHELRTPLALLRTELELALRHPRSRAELEDALRSAAEETERLTALAADLLLLARAEQGALAIQPEPVSAHELLAEVARRFSARAEEADRTIEVADGDDVAFDGDPRRLEQALGNLVDNALVHGRGAVVLFAAVTGAALELHVSDEGPGFPEGFATRAFDRFARADEARPRPGSGLGLAIVQTIASAHGGTASVSTEPGVADVWIALPRGGGQQPHSRIRRVGAARR